MAVYLDNSTRNIQYPVRIMARDSEDHYRPHLSVLSKNQIEIQLPPSVPEKDLSLFQSYLRELPRVISNVREQFRQLQREDT